MRGCLRRSIKCAGRSVCRQRRSFWPGGGPPAEGSLSPGWFSTLLVFSASLTSRFWSRSFLFIGIFSHGAAQLCPVHFGFNNFQDAAAHGFQRRRVDIYAVQPVGGLRQVEFLLQPYGEIVVVELEAQAGIDKVIVDGRNTR